MRHIYRIAHRLVRLGKCPWEARSSERVRKMVDRLKAFEEAHPTNPLYLKHASRMWLIGKARQCVREDGSDRERVMGILRDHLQGVTP